MSAKKAILIFGPESTGTRLATRYCISAGCKGDFGHKQEFDNEHPANEKLIVWRRSVPHNKCWPRIDEMVSELRNKNYSVYSIVTTRDFYCTAKSQVNNKHVESFTKAIENIRKAYAHIFNLLFVMDVPYILWSYENIVARPHKSPSKLLEFFGLKFSTHIPIIDGNIKHYE